MITNNQVALCNSLNMNFDEASELFCEESLQSMQMAKVNGGALWDVIVTLAIDALNLIITGYEFIAGKKGTTGPTESSCTITKIIDGDKSYTISAVLLPGDTLKISDGSEVKWITIVKSSNGSQSSGSTVAPTK